ncbi:hypothetical protein [Nocardioides sp. AX2bis]|uniref:hypothetical protein n=1 Tax=Nocardioides sp. AX2bis TaxID=2653157 RepID=UPI00135BEBA8|nr:hypothetical protein [Nocardioides sp. AX2bis]
MSTTTAPPVAATSAGPVRQRVRGMVRSCGPWWALLAIGAVMGQVPWGTELLVAWGVLLLASVVVNPVARRLRRREELAYGGPGQRDFFEQALTGDRVPRDGDVEAWRRHLPVLRLRAREAVLAMPWVGLVVLALAAFTAVLVLTGRGEGAYGTSSVATLTVLAWPFYASHLRRRRDRLDALAERLER